MDVEILMKLSGKDSVDETIKKYESYFFCCFVARILNKEESVVEVGGLLIELNIPISS